MGQAAGLAAGGAALGAISGAGGSEQTTTRNIAPAGSLERELQNMSFQNYLSQQNLVDQQQADIAKGEPIQQAARGGLMDIFGGQAFQATPEEEMRINQYRQALIDQGTADVQNMMNPLFQRAMNSAGVRGVRGQALSQLQGDVLSAGAREMGNLTRQANITAAQQLMDNPYRRAAFQGNLANQNANFMEQLRQNAINNRNVLQNPALMQSLQNERIASASTTTSQPGSLGSMIGGALGGAGALLGAGADFKKIS